MFFKEAQSNSKKIGQTACDFSNCYGARKDKNRIKQGLDLYFLIIENKFRSTILMTKGNSESNFNQILQKL